MSNSLHLKQRLFLGKTMNLVITIVLLLLAQILIWFGSNAQLVDGWDKSKALYLSLLLAAPTAVVVFYGTRYGFAAMGTLWSVRLLAFGLSYLVFPILTWILLDESPFNTKTMICISLSMLIVFIQILVPNT